MDDQNNRSSQRFSSDGQNKHRKNNGDEEYAAEFVAADSGSETSGESTSTFGWIGIVLSFISFLMWPLLFGVAGIILGFMSRNRGADTLGNIAIGIGVLSIVFRLFI